MPYEIAFHRSDMPNYRGRRIKHAKDERDAVKLAFGKAGKPGDRIPGRHGVSFHIISVTHVPPII